jgi:microcystin-dependent protein
MDPFIGEIIMFAGTFAPRGWAFCDGQLLPIAANQALFSIVGTAYGGDGRATFALPDLRGRVPVHPGTGPGLSTRKLGQRSGSETNTLLIDNLAPHTHFATVSASSVPASLSGPVSIDISTNGAQGTEDSPKNNYLAAGPTVGKTPFTPYSTTEDGTMMATQTGTATVQGNLDLSGIQVTNGSTGASTPINNVQPYLAINFIISLQGVYPSRS